MDIILLLVSNILLSVALILDLRRGWKFYILLGLSSGITGTVIGNLIR